MQRYKMKYTFAASYLWNCKYTKDISIFFYGRYAKVYIYYDTYFR